ncbi:uncharacterized protein BJ212DRAFT_1335012, partial [Suillus subaureus]
LGCLLQEIIVHPGDIHWVRQPSNFNSCLPADISSYKALPCTLSRLSEDELHSSVSTLRYRNCTPTSPFLVSRTPDCNYFALHFPSQKSGGGLVKKGTL